MLHMFFISQPEDRMKQVPTVLFFHGNAGNMGHRYDIFSGIIYSVKVSNIYFFLIWKFFIRER